VHMLASDPRRRRGPGDHFLIAGIEHEDYPDGLAIPTGISKTSEDQRKFHRRVRMTPS
jgi:hypothetical protein